MQNFVCHKINNVQILEHDATIDIPKFHKKANKIVFAALCYALGVISRYPKKCGMMQQGLKEFPALQIYIPDIIKNWIKKAFLFLFHVHG